MPSSSSLINLLFHVGLFSRLFSASRVKHKHSAVSFPELQMYILLVLRCTDLFINLWILSITWGFICLPQRDHSNLTSPTLHDDQHKRKYDASLGAWDLLCLRKPRGPARFIDGTGLQGALPSPFISEVVLFLNTFIDAAVKHLSLVRKPRNSLSGRILSPGRFLDPAFKLQQRGSYAQMSFNLALPRNLLTFPSANVPAWSHRH